MDREFWNQSFHSFFGKAKIDGNLGMEKFELYILVVEM